MNTKVKLSALFLFPLLFLAGLLLLSLDGAGAAAAPANRSSDADSMSCDGSLADCTEVEEMLMESGISRRFLAAQTQKRISYNAIAANQPICGVNRGQPYAGSCLPPPSNNYGRGCLRRDNCRGGKSNTFD